MTIDFGPCAEVWSVLVLQIWRLLKPDRPIAFCCSPVDTCRKEYGKAELRERLLQLAEEFSPTLRRAFDPTPVQRRPLPVAEVE